MKKFNIRTIIFFICICIVMIRVFFFDCIYIKGDSMKDAYKNGEVVLIEKQYDSLERFDVVVCDTGRFGINNKIIKRIIGLPNERVQIRDGYVFIDGKKIEDIVHIKMDYAGIAEKEILLGENQFFLLGDNRNNSGDSRHEWLGGVNKDQIIGKVICTIVEK